MDRLAIFDFDGTLFRSPCNTEENKKFYQQQTGIPWHISKELSVQLSQKLGKHVRTRNGWWGNGASLEPPLVPDPTPKNLWITETLEEYWKSRSCSKSITLILTGRHSGLERQVLRILHDGGIGNIQKSPKENGFHYKWTDSLSNIFLLGMQGPRPNTSPPRETFPWKVWIIKQHLEIYPTIKLVEIWEDREEHIEEFSKLGDELKKEVIVHAVKS